MSTTLRAVGLTCFALLAFALNSILCRMALAGGAADASGFTTVRILSGAAMLVVIWALSYKTRSVAKSGNWGSAFFLFAYAFTFSFAYVSLTAASGALILFGAVQVTMIGWAALRGQSPGPLESIGAAAAAGGLVYLSWPGLASPPLTGVLLMAAAGIAWGLYTVRGKCSEDPLGDTIGNFVRAVPMATAAALPFLASLRMSPWGVLLAFLSGAVTSGVGYAVWYAALRYHNATRAAVGGFSVDAGESLCFLLTK